MIRLRATRRIAHDHVVFEPGEQLDVASEHAAALLACGAAERCDDGAGCAPEPADVAPADAARDAAFAAAAGAPRGRRARAPKG